MNCLSSILGKSKQTFGNNSIRFLTLMMVFVSMCSRVFCLPGVDLMLGLRA